MKYKEKLLPLPDLRGHIYISVDQYEEERDSGTKGDVAISGDQKGLEALGKLLIAFSKIDQSKIHEDNLPEFESEHIHLYVGAHLNSGFLDTYDMSIHRLDQKNGDLKNYFDDKIKKNREIGAYRKIKVD